MKVCLYFENINLIKRSGIGRALKHQMEACHRMNIEITLNPNDDYDILHINTIGIKSYYLLHKAKKKNIKIIYHAHSTEEDFRNSFIFSNQLSKYFKMHLINCYSKADLILTPTNYSKKLLENYQMNKKIIVLSNGIDENKFNYDENKILKFKEYFNIKDEKVFISVGLYLERKGILDFVEIAKKYPYVKFIWFGKTPLYLIPRKIRKIIKNHPPNVIFPGYIDGEILEGAYSGANGFLFLSNEETEGIVVLEALASKQHVIVKDIGVFEDWLENKVNCFKGNSILEFSKIIDYLLENQDEKMKEEARKVIVDKNLTEIGKKLKQIYENV